MDIDQDKRSLNNPGGETQRTEHLADLIDSKPDAEAQAAVVRAKQILYVDRTDFDDQARPITVPVPSPFYANYLRKRQAYEDALAAYNASYLQYDLSNPADARKWSILGPVLQRSVDRAWAALQGARPGVIESALATLGQFQQSSGKK